MPTELTELEREEDVFTPVTWPECSPLIRTRLDEMYSTADLLLRMHEMPETLRDALGDVRDSIDIAKFEARERRNTSELPCSCYDCGWFGKVGDCKRVTDGVAKWLACPICKATVRVTGEPGSVLAHQTGEYPASWQA